MRVLADFVILFPQQSSHFCRFVVPSRNVLSAAALKPSILAKPVFSTSEEGYQVRSPLEVVLAENVVLTGNSLIAYFYRCRNMHLFHLRRILAQKTVQRNT